MSNHRIIYYKKTGHCPTREEVIHHIDGNHNNNDPKNLMLFNNNSDHLKYHNKDKIRVQTKITPVRCTLAFVELCREQSKVYPLDPHEGGAKLSAARFLKEAAKEKLLCLGIKKAYIKSIC